MTVHKGHALQAKLVTHTCIHLGETPPQKKKKKKKSQLTFLIVFAIFLNVKNKLAEMSHTLKHCLQKKKERKKERNIEKNRKERE